MVKFSCFRFIGILWGKPGHCISSQYPGSLEGKVLAVVWEINTCLAFIWEGGVQH